MINPEVLLQEPPLNPPKKSKSCIVPFLAISFVAIILLFCIYFKLPSSSLQNHKEIPLNETIRLSVQPSQDIIHAEPQTISMAISLKAENFTLTSREPIDLVCIVDFPGARRDWLFEIAQEGLRKVLPLMNDQDRLSIVIFDEGLPNELIVYNLINTTQENKETIFLASGTDTPLRGNMTYGSLRTAIEILNQRETANSKTGIIHFSKDWKRDEINKIFQTLVSQNGKHSFLFSFDADADHQLWHFPPRPPSFWPYLHQLDQAFEKSLIELQTSILGNLEVFIKPEQSEFIQNVKILPMEEYYNVRTWEQENGVFRMKGVNLVPEKQKNFVLAIQIPDVIYSESEMKVKIASCEVVFTLSNGEKVVENMDLTVKIIKEKEDIYRDRESRNVVWTSSDIMNSLLRERREKMTFYKGYEEVCHKGIEDCDL